MSPRCPLCPHLIQNNVMELAWHLNCYHKLGNSAPILARAMCASQVGYQEVMQVLKDVANIDQANLSHETIDKLEMEFMKPTKVKKEKDLTTIDKLCQTESELEEKGVKDVKIIELKKLEITTIDKFCQTEREFLDKEQKGFKDLDIDELKRNIRQKQSNVEWLNNEILDTEIKLIMHKKKKIVVTESELVQQVAKKDQVTKELKLRKTCNKELKLKVEELTKEKENYRKVCEELTNEKENYRKNTSQLIESQREVHEKEIQDLNLKLQNQINKSHVLKSRDKSLMDEVEMLKASLFNKNEQNLNLTKKVKSLEEKVLENVHRGEVKEIKVVDVDSMHLRAKIMKTEAQMDKLEKEIVCLKDHIYKQGKEYLDLQHHSKASITEKDNRINCLEHELRCVKENSEIIMDELRCLKADSGIIVDEIEKRTKEKIDCDTQIAEMKARLVDYKETLVILKNSLTGLVAMHEETSDKIVEVFRNTSRIGQEALNDGKKRFISIEEETSGEFSSLCDFNKNIIIKTEKCDLEVRARSIEDETKEDDINSPSLDSDREGCKKSSFNEELVAQDFSWQFDSFFGGPGSSRNEDEDEDRSGRGSSKSKSKKRKFDSIL